MNNVAYGERTGNIGDHSYFGGDGNDYITTQHTSTGEGLIYGGNGEDIIIQGDGGSASYGFLVGNDGDDKIYGGHVNTAG